MQIIYKIYEKDFHNTIYLLDPPQSRRSNYFSPFFLLLILMLLIILLKLLKILLIHLSNLMHGK